jgi:ribosomal protein L11 methyltransferase
LAYIEVDINIGDKRIIGSDITVAELGSEGYESFMDTDYGIKAYIREEHFDPSFLKRLTIFSSDEYGKTSYSTRLIKDTNWNEKWESEYQSISISDFCYIRSPFHPPGEKYQYEIIIEPKMSFGTGHHETTFLMLSRMKDLNFRDKAVLDLGCGTGILSILASMLGAAEITAIDTDEWAYKNSIENLQLNKIKNCRVIQGSIEAVAGKQYSIILANITRNINLEYMNEYKKLAKPGTYLLLSGFYRDDLEIIKNEAGLKGFSYIDYLEKKNWVSVLFIRQ